MTIDKKIYDKRDLIKKIHYDFLSDKDKKDPKILPFKYKKPFKIEMEEFEQRQKELMDNLKGDEAKVLKIEDPLYQEYLKALKNGTIKKGTSFDRFEKDHFDFLLDMQEAKNRQLEELKNRFLDNTDIKSAEGGIVTLR